MADSLLETKLKEAVERSRGDRQVAVRLLIAWCETDEALFRALAQPFLQGIALHLIDRAIKQITGDPTAPLAAQTQGGGAAKTDGAKGAKAAETDDDSADAATASRAAKPATAGKTLDIGTASDKPAAKPTDDAAGDESGMASKVTKSASGKTLDIGATSETSAAKATGTDAADAPAASQAAKPASGKTLDIGAVSDKQTAKSGGTAAGDDADAAAAPQAAKPASGKTLDIGVGSDKQAAKPVAAKAPVAKAPVAKAPPEEIPADEEAAEPPMVVRRRTRKGELPPALIDALVERWGSKIPVATQPTLDHPPRTVEEALQSLGKAGPPPPGKASGRHQSGMRLIAKVQRIRRATQG